MKNLALLLFIILFMGMGSKPKTPSVTVEFPPVISVSGKTLIQLKVKASASQVSRITKLVGISERIINSPEFKSRVLNAWYQGKAKFYDTKLSNEQVYASIMAGSELGNKANNIWDMEIGIEKNDCNVLGWTYPNIKMFYFNSCGFDKRDDAGITGTICHEFSHKLGFDHSYEWTKHREYSVPYEIGTICAELYDDFKTVKN